MRPPLQKRRRRGRERGGKFGLAGKFEMFRNRCCGNLVRPRVKLKPCNRVRMEGNTCCQQVRNLPRPTGEQLGTGGAEFFPPRHARSTDALCLVSGTDLGIFFFFFLEYILAILSVFFLFYLNSFKLHSRILNGIERWKSRGENEKFCLEQLVFFIGVFIKFDIS